MRGTIENFPIAWARILMRILVFPLGNRYKPASDKLAHKAVKAVLQPGDVRDRLTRYMYVSQDPNDPTGVLEVTLKKVIEAEAAEKKLEKAIRAGQIKRFHGIDWIGDAQAKNVILESEANLLREVESLVARVIAVDHFDPAEVKPHYLTPGHNAQAATSSLATDGGDKSEQGAAAE